MFPSLFLDGGSGGSRLFSLRGEALFEVGDLGLARRNGFRKFRVTGAHWLTLRDKMFMALSLGGDCEAQFGQLLHCVVFTLREIILRGPQKPLLTSVRLQRGLFSGQFVFQFGNAFVCNLDLSGQRSLLRANLGLLLFAFLQFSREKKNLIVATGLFTFRGLVFSAGFFQLAACVLQCASGVVACFKQTVVLLPDLGTFPVQGRNSRFAFEQGIRRCFPAPTKHNSLG